MTDQNHKENLMEAHRNRKKIVICDECNEEFLTTKATKCLDCKKREAQKRRYLSKKARK